MSLSGQYDGNNIFAKIIRGEIPAVKIYEDEAVLAFMDVFPQSKGHCLVISKTAEARNLLEIDGQALGAVMVTVQNLAKAVTTALNPDGLVITQFNGALAGQTVFHLHFHIIPRYDGVALAGHGHGTMADMADLKALAAQISAAL
jgi:histidine triad (HIT) family protein